MIDTLYLLAKGKAVFVPGDDLSDEARDYVLRIVSEWAAGRTKVLVMKRPCDVKDWRDGGPYA